MSERVYHIGIYALGNTLVATYQVKATSLENARELAWDLFIQDSFADEVK